MRWCSGENLAMNSASRASATRGGSSAGNERAPLEVDLLPVSVRIWASLREYLLDGSRGVAPLAADTRRAARHTRQNAERVGGPAAGREGVVEKRESRFPRRHWRCPPCAAG